MTISVVRPVCHQRASRGEIVSGQAQPCHPNPPMAHAGPRNDVCGIHSREMTPPHRLPCSRSDPLAQLEPESSYQSMAGWTLAFIGLPGTGSIRAAIINVNSDFHNSSPIPYHGMLHPVCMCLSTIIAVYPCQLLEKKEPSMHTTWSEKYLLPVSMIPCLVN